VPDTRRCNKQVSPFVDKLPLEQLIDPLSFGKIYKLEIRDTPPVKAEPPPAAAQMSGADMREELQRIEAKGRSHIP
jgi:hypothetical protein